MTWDITVLLGDPRIRNSSLRSRPAELIALEKLHSALSELGPFRFRYVNEHKNLIKELRTSPPSFVFNLCNNGFQNEPKMEAHIPALLDVLGIPYSGSGPACLAMCRDQSLVRGLATSLGIPVACEAERVSESVQTEAQPRHEFLGSQYTVGLIGNSPGGFDVLTIVERERFDRPFPRPVVSYRVRRGPREESYRYREAKLSGQNQRRMRDQAIKLFERLDCRDYGCVDFCADNDGEIKLLSVNPNPDWDWNSPLAASASLKGLQYVRLLHTILNIAVARVNISLCGTSDRTLSSLRALPT